MLEEADKLRVLHDGTHKTRINHLVRCRDKQRMPGVGEMHTINREARDRGDIMMAILGDFKGAHRTIKICQDEWGMLGCKLRSPTTWVNKVGTFGCSSAAYWWGRLAGALLRCVWGLLGAGNPLEALLFADDLALFTVGAGGRKSGVLFIFYLILLGSPLKWKKFRGGFNVDWIGLHLCMKEFSLGLSEARAGWVISWISSTLATGKVGTREMAGALGRLNFAATALIYEKAFLGILYLWTSAILQGKAEVVSLPWAVRLVLTWLHRRLVGGHRLQVTPNIPTASEDELFRSDAKAETGGLATIGGWECARSCPPGKARWFFLAVTEDWAPWAFAKKSDPQRVIATLELLGTLLCIMLFGDDWRDQLRGSGCISGGTDNKGNTYAVSKLLSTKWPLTSLLLELSEQLRVRSLDLHLLWRRRDTNTEADSITNGDFSLFDPALRVPCDPATLPWKVLPEVMEASRTLYETIITERELARVEGKRKPSWSKLAAGKRFRTTQPW